VALAAERLNARSRLRLSPTISTAIRRATSYASTPWRALNKSTVPSI
jgi:hypothetical protein